MTKAYVPIVAKRKDSPFDQLQKEWQLMRRGRCFDRPTIAAAAAATAAATTTQPTS